jgi:hypothetical protein
MAVGGFVRPSEATFGSAPAPTQPTHGEGHTDGIARKAGPVGGHNSPRDVEGDEGGWPRYPLARGCDVYASDLPLAKSLGSSDE